MDYTNLQEKVQEELESGNPIDEFGYRQFFLHICNLLLDDDLRRSENFESFTRFVYSKYSLSDREKEIRESDLAFDYGVAFACSGIYDQYELLVHDPLEERKVMDIELLDYEGKCHKVSVDMNDVNDIYLMILSGDEVLRVHRKNGEEEIIDPMKDERTTDIYQGGYYIYDATNPVDIYDLTEDEKWKNRKFSDIYLIDRRSEDDTHTQR